MSILLEDKIDEKEIAKAKKEFDLFGLALHFGGEVAGLLYLVSFKGFFVPFLNNKTTDLKSIIAGLAVYAIPQIPAFYLKGLSLTKERNELLANKFRGNYERHAKKGKTGRFFGLPDKLMYKIYDYFARNQEYSNRIAGKYIGLKRRIRSLIHL